MVLQMNSRVLYRYLFYDILSRAATVETPLYGTNFERILNRAGDGNFTAMLGLEELSDREIIDGTRPGATMVFVERNGALVWSGIVWTRTWQEQSETLQYYAATPESFFHAQVIEETLEFDNEDQRNIVILLVEHMQTKLGADLGITTPDLFSSDAPDAIKRTVKFPNYEGWTYGKALDYIANYDEGLDWTIDPSWGTDGEPQLSLRVDNVLGIPEGSDIAPVFDYPGNIKNFWYPESASKGSVTTVGFGKGEGSAIVRSKHRHADMLGRGYPDLQRIYTNKDVSEQSTLDAQTRAANESNKVPRVTPTLQLNPVEEVMPSSWGLGDFCRIAIQSKRFPDGFEMYTRAIGWQLDPPDGDSVEGLKLIIPGQEGEVD